MNWGWLAVRFIRRLRMKFLPFLPFLLSYSSGYFTQDAIRAAIVAYSKKIRHESVKELDSIISRILKPDDMMPSDDFSVWFSPAM